MKSISDSVQSFAPSATPLHKYQRITAADLGLKEAWLRDAIFLDPELVLGACRAAGLTDDEWYAWRKEFPTEVGPIDVLLVSSQGRLGIVETKLCSNAELRRKVLAQALDYLVHLSDEFSGEMPELPKDAEGNPVADEDDVREALDQGDILIVIASDEIDDRIGRLSKGLLSENPVKQWELALVDLAMYRRDDSASAEFLVVPNVRYAVQSEQRHVVRVIVQGENPKARVEVERVEVGVRPDGRQKWDQQRFFESLAVLKAAAPVQQLARDLVEMAREYPETVGIDWGTGRKGSMVLKRNDAGLIEVHGAGYIRFRPRKFKRALGDEVGQQYEDALKRLVPTAMAMSYPKLPESQAARNAAELLQTLRAALASAESQR